MDQHHKKWHLSDNINDWIKLHLDISSYPHRIFYNDEVKEEDQIKKMNNRAHAKGVILWNDDHIKWLIHSCPQWPSSDSLEFTHTNIIYGQSFILLELPISLLSSILKHIEIMFVYIYHSSEPLKEHGKDQIDKCQLAENIWHIAKNCTWKKDIYDDYLVSLFGTNILSESWLRPYEPGSNRVKNADIIIWPDGTTYHETHDHSKYAISTNHQHPWIYIGDLNHMESQTKRGGGGIIMNDIEVWEEFHRLFHSSS
jgi:hypothetical protein